jgi:serine protease Do
VLRIDADDLTPVVLGDSDVVKVGDDVLAIGNPLGELSFSLTKGCISALDRAVIVEDKPMTLFQTDCAINAGNSGGALFDMYGRVIGITNAKYSRSAMSSEASIENIGFAIPINSVSSIISDIIEKGYISKPFIGVMCQTVDSKMQGLGLPSGVSIEEVIDGGPAEAAGLLPNDIITAVNGKAISSTDDLKREIKNAGIGGKLTLTIYRQGDVFDVDVDVVEQQVSALGDTDG